MSITTATALGQAAFTALLGPLGTLSIHAMSNTGPCLESVEAPVLTQSCATVQPGDVLSLKQQPAAMASTTSTSQYRQFAANIQNTAALSPNAAPVSSVPSQHTKLNPFVTRLKDRHRLTKPGSGKNTQHLVIDLKGSGLKYECGDSLGIFPTNDPLVVSRTVFALGSTADAPVAGYTEPLSEVLAKKFNISRVPGAFAKWVLEKNASSVKDSPALQQLQAVATDGPKLTKYLEGFEVWDFLQKHNSIALDPSEAVGKLGALLPRLYSISSAQAKVGDEVHLSVAVVDYKTSGLQRYGVCTNFLCNRLPVDDKSIPIYVQSSDFKPPKDPNTPMIMIGPGTGVAPFRAFLQEREVSGAKGPNWLFFGEWNRATDFFYEDYWRELEQKGILRIDAAFSRDQKQKIYVQDLMISNGEQFWQWLEKGAAVYVCGDASRMAKDVDKALHAIIEKYGRRTPKEAREYVKKLRQSHRYQRDIY